MVRLNSNLLQPIPQMSYHSTFLSHLTIALLNVRSLLAKLPDIKADNSLMSATIQCFCETWLNASQPSPVLNDDHIDIRCDRVTSANKGGVMMYVPNQMHLFNTQRFVTNGIEAISVTQGLPNAGHLKLALLYRSPSVCLSTLTTVLHRLLRHLSLSNTPCVLLWEILMKMCCTSRT